jgi:hypothetical protein
MLMKEPYLSLRTSQPYWEGIISLVCCYLHANSHKVATPVGTSNQSKHQSGVVRNSAHNRHYVIYVTVAVAVRGLGKQADISPCKRKGHGRRL